MVRSIKHQTDSRRKSWNDRHKANYDINTWQYYIIISMHRTQNKHRKKKRGRTRRAKHKYTQRTIWKNCQWYLESIVHLIKKKYLSNDFNEMCRCFPLSSLRFPSLLPVTRHWFEWYGIWQMQLFACQREVDRPREEMYDMIEANDYYGEIVASLQSSIIICPGIKRTLTIEHVTISILFTWFVGFISKIDPITVN